MSEAGARPATAEGTSRVETETGRSDNGMDAELDQLGRSGAEPRGRERGPPPGREAEAWQNRGGSGAQAGLDQDGTGGEVERNQNGSSQAPLNRSGSGNEPDNLGPLGDGTSKESDAASRNQHEVQSELLEKRARTLLEGGGKLGLPVQGASTPNALGLTAESYSRDRSRTCGGRSSKRKTFLNLNLRGGAEGLYRFGE